MEVLRPLLRPTFKRTDYMVEKTFHFEPYLGPLAAIIIILINLFSSCFCFRYNEAAKQHFTLSEITMALHFLELLPPKRTRNASNYYTRKPVGFK